LKPPRLGGRFIEEDEDGKVKALGGDEEGPGFDDRNS
jgi:hypothetical protein